jgi:hypothetical protein
MKDGLARLGKVVNHAIDKFIGIILETRKGYNQTVFLYNAGGDDSVPCKNDKGIILKIDGTGNFIGAGILVESQGAKPGEKIFFGRDQKGNNVVKIFMLNDGSYTIDTDTETTGDAAGDYNRKIKGVTNILERKDKTYKNEANVNEEIEKDKTTLIGGDENRYIEGNRITNTNGGESQSVLQDYTLNVGGNLNINAGGTIRINGAVIHWK